MRSFLCVHVTYTVFITDADPRSFNLEAVLVSSEEVEESATAMAELQKEAEDARYVASSITPSIQVFSSSMRITTLDQQCSCCRLAAMTAMAELQKQAAFDWRDE